MAAIVQNFPGQQRLKQIMHLRGAVTYSRISVLPEPG